MTTNYFFHLIYRVLFQPQLDMAPGSLGLSVAPSLWSQLKSAIGLTKFCTDIRASQRMKISELSSNIQQGVFNWLSQYDINESN